MIRDVVLWCPSLKIPPFQFWRTIFWLIPTISVYTIALGTLSVGASWFDRTGKFAHACARFWAWLILATTGVQVSVSGLGRVKKELAYVFVSNHESIYDIPIIFASLPFQLRIIAKASLGSFPFLGWHLRRTGHLLVDRGRPDRSAIVSWASRLTAQGLSLIVFPEGTRSRDGRVGRFKGGSFYLALEAKLSVVPLSVAGSRHVMLKGRLATYPGEVRLIVHEPIDTSSLEGTDPKEFGEYVRQIIRPDAEADCELLHRT